MKPHFLHISVLERPRIERGQGGRKMEGGQCWQGFVVHLAGHREDDCSRL